jgi:ribonucleoside-diphosphate reductase alpha chain
LRIDPGSLRSFGKFVAVLPGKKLAQLASVVAQSNALPQAAEGNWDRVASLTPVGKRQVFDLTEPVTASFVANGLTVHNCSEYMFLDDTACNLASLNVLTFFDAESRRFDVEGYKHAIRLWTIVLEISVLMASFPSEAIARLSYKFRTLGLGYANLGAMLMQAGIPYDSEKGRAICGALTAVLTGESYATSAEMARELGAFPGFEQNKTDMLRVMRNHRRAAYDVSHNPAARRSLNGYEKLEIEPVGIDDKQFADNDPVAPRGLINAARECWDRALSLGATYGYRNAQTTVIAPTGTIGLLMDCDTTGVEPDFALVKFKKLAGGGYFKIANQSLAPALRNLGYTDSEIHDVLRYVMGTLTLHDAPHLSYERLERLGFTAAELDKVESTLPGVFEISFAFSPWSLGAEVMKRFDLTEEQWQAPNFNLLRHLGFTRKQIEEANDVICGRGTVEGAPHLKDEHLPVFDCANKCGRHGRRFIAVEGHIRMMAAAQPFISGAISKTINLPNEATVEDIKNSYHLSWKLGLKANALYRDGSKLSQPLNVKSDEDLEDEADEEDEEAVDAAREEVAAEVVHAAAEVQSAIGSRQSAITSDNLGPAHPIPHTIERIVERVVERPLRRRLPDTRRAITHKFDVGGHEGYITTGLYEDGTPGEVFIRISKEGSTVGGLMDTIATLVSLALQYGVPVDSLVRKFEHVRFEPSGMTRNPEIPIAKSLVDYIFRYLAMEFVPGYRAQNAPKRSKKLEPPKPPEESIDVPPGEGGGEGVSDRPHAKKKEGNGHGPRLDPDPHKQLDYGDTAADQAALSDDALRALHAPHLQAPEVGSPTPSGPNLRLAIVSDPLSQQGTELQADAPACDVCGSITVRSGTCYKCLNCGNSMGCS